MLLWNCAQQGSPSGGPRDEDPPVVLEAEPPNYSTMFTAKKITITFDEFIVLDNVNQELIVSPPMEEKPEVKLRKKSIIIEFEEALKDSTTYTFNFGSAIKDLHEGNKLLNYEYVFSTGPELDSLSVKGTLKYAEDLLEPEDPISIMLYTDLSDSVPLLDIPLYVGRSDDSGVFSVNNLRSDVYKVFALKDGNNNFLFDLPTEEIAFLDTSLIVSAEFARSLLGIAEDSLQLAEDSLKGFQTDSVIALPDSAALAIDSLITEGPDLNSIYIDLLLFIEEQEIQYITDYNRDDPRRILMSFARPLTDSFEYRSLLVEHEEPLEMLEYFTSDRDSLTLWVKDSIFYKLDTIPMEIRYTMLDTAEMHFTQIDTLLFTYRKPRMSGKKEEEKEELEQLKITTIRSNGELHLNRNLHLDLDFPLLGFNDSLISFFHIPDTVEIEKEFSAFADSSQLTRGWISTDWESAASYHLLLLPGAVASIYPMQHDTLDLKFKTRDTEYYGQILLTLEGVEHSVIVQLLSKDKVIQQAVVENSGLHTFSYLSPMDYRIKVIHDLNRNGLWDTGDYLNKLQPEPVEFLPTTISVRSNWDHDVTMTLQK